MVLEPAPQPNVLAVFTGSCKILSTVGQAHCTDRLIVAGHDILVGVIEHFSKANLAFGHREGNHNRALFVLRRVGRLLLVINSFVGERVRGLPTYTSRCHGNLAKTKIIVVGVQAVNQSQVKEVEDVSFRVENHAKSTQSKAWVSKR